MKATPIPAHKKLRNERNADSALSRSDPPPPVLGQNYSQSMPPAVCSSLRAT
ncbi:MAG: hypothetical protein MI923_17100 [Phycisphaerales bacterium]|nr:hypothetical protein [Phycisphaerales bacterium]